MYQLFLSLAGINLSGFEGLIVILFILGIALVIVELIMPGIGIAGILGIISLIAGIVLAAQVVSTATLVLIITVVLLIIAGMLIFLYKSATKKDSRLSRLLLLNTRTGTEEGFTSTKVEEDLAGLEGIAETALRPAGTADFQGRRLDVVTNGEFIAKGTPVKITQVEGFRIIVEKLEKE